MRRDVQWSTCALSSQPLQPPIVADYLGRLYNKEALLQHLACKWVGCQQVGRWYTGICTLASLLAASSTHWARR